MSTPSERAEHGAEPKPESQDGLPPRGKTPWLGVVIAIGVFALLVLAGMLK